MYLYIILYYILIYIIILLLKMCNIYLSHSPWELEAGSSHPPAELWVPNYRKLPGNSERNPKQKEFFAAFRKEKETAPLSGWFNIVLPLMNPILDDECSAWPLCKSQRSIRRVRKKPGGVWPLAHQEEAERFWNKHSGKCLWQNY